MDKDEKPFKCTICQKRFNYKQQLEAHKSTHTTIYTCDLCAYSTNNKKYVGRHKKLRHEAPTENECDFCGKKFHFRSKMLHHRRTHTGEKPNQCKECGRTFNAKFSLDTHMLIHANVKPFHCSFCTYACRDRSSLRKHETIHTGLRPLYRCKQCDKTFKQKWRLKMHVAEDHLSLDVRKYECGECGRRFKVKALLRLHIRSVHEKSTRCKCKICGRVLSNKGNIWQHMAIHVDVRPYKCNKKGCGKKYKDPSSLRKHSKVHLNLPKVRKVRNVVKKVECDYCAVRFLSKNYLQNHILRKHLKKTQKFRCDMCKFVTRNKPSLVMHIKYGHVSESDRKCKICKKTYKRHMYLKAHYARTHGIRYKTKQRKKQIEIKEEPEDAVSIDLFEIEKQEVLDDFNFDASDANLDPNQDAKSEKANITEVAANLENVPEAVFEEFYEKHVVLRDDIVKERKPIRGMRNKIAKENARKCVEKLLVEVKQREDTAALDKVRQMYNNRLKTIASSAPIQEKVKIKYFNNNKSEENRDRLKNNAAEIDDDDGNGDSISVDVDDSTIEQIDKGGTEEKEVVNENKRSHGKLQINSHQCYICFKLFETKEKLIDHCKYHFDICHEISLKKCPICQYVSNRNITRHLRLVHKIKIKLPSKVHDKLENKGGSRYYYEIKNSKEIDKMEIIPSIKNLNKIACTNIDKKNRERKEKIIAKTKLVKKSGEWIVVKEKIDVKMDDLVLPKFDVKNFAGAESYMDRMKNLYHAAKKLGKKILFPCEHCDKICQSLAALKLHSRKHDPNAKPFKPKVWKHKLKEQPVKMVKKVKQNTENHLAKPKPIVNKHKCENELKEFYTKNIRGGDIEFWQFLKIYNRMSKENVKNFEDLESRTDFGIHLKNDPQNVVETVKKRCVKNKNAFRRVVRISKNEYLRRNAIRNELRKKIAKEKDNAKGNL